MENQKHEENQRHEILFSIIVVALNPGEKLSKTINSILTQDYGRYEIIVKDGMSDDGSVEKLEKEAAAGNRLKICRKKDQSIYDAMNQAIDLVTGDYILFLNCGDTFYNRTVLSKTAGNILQNKEKEGGRPIIIYGNTYSEQTGTIVHSAPVISGFTCYRNIPCHQSCFYDRSLFEDRKYRTEYKIRADYDHFLWCYYRKGAKMVYMDIVAASYEGGGYSESKENQKRDRLEHRKITGEYMDKLPLLAYRTAMLLTLAPLRRVLAGSKSASGWYHKIKDLVYQKVR